MKTYHIIDNKIYEKETTKETEKYIYFGRIKIKKTNSHIHKIFLSKNEANISLKDSIKEKFSSIAYHQNEINTLQEDITKILLYLKWEDTLKIYNLINK